MKRENEELLKILFYFDSLKIAIVNKDENFDYSYFFETIYLNNNEHEKFKKFVFPFIDDAIDSALKIIKNDGEDDYEKC